MFKFNFSNEDVDNDSDQNTIKKSTKWLESSEIHTNNSTNLDNFSILGLKCGNYAVKYLSSDDVVCRLKRHPESNSNSIISAEQNHSDLLTAIYEGGLKIWECTHDLLNYINDNDINLDNKRVLDLGCGAGLVGIFCSLKGATCYFQDYNKEVIELITIPNVAVNGCKDNSRFFCGDWNSFSALLEEQNCGKFDYIFTSETIYNPDNYYKLLTIFENNLKKTGTVYLAAKCHYFGVGGGLSQFQETLNDTQIFNSETVWNCNEGIKRAIIKIQLKR